MKIIILTGKHGICTMVSDDDYDELSKYRWFAKPSAQCFYVCRSKRVGSKVVTVRMHREIAKTPDSMDCDHVDYDTMNNQRENLRNVTRLVHNQRKCKVKE